jgi:acetyl esterase/lipase
MTRRGLIFLCAAVGPAAFGQNLTVQDYLELPRPAPDHRITYGSDPLQFGELRLPSGPGPHPVAIALHGGCWRAVYGLEPLSSFCAALTEAGVATWSLEYRRVGNPGGGWPGTFEDVARGADHLRSLAQEHRLDLNRVLAVGHSAGGHLALWLAARRRLPKESALFTSHPLPLLAVVSLAGIPDLRAAEARSICGDVIPRLAGGHYELTSPLELLPLGIPQRLINGGRDTVVPLELGKSYEKAARERGDEVELVVLEEAAHFEVVSPQSAAWSVVKQNVLSLLKK